MCVAAAVLVHVLVPPRTHRVSHKVRHATQHGLHNDLGRPGLSNGGGAHSPNPNATPTSASWGADRGASRVRANSTRPPRGSITCVGCPQHGQLHPRRSAFSRLPQGVADVTSDTRPVNVNVNAHVHVHVHVNVHANVHVNVHASVRRAQHVGRAGVGTTATDIVTVGCSGWRAGNHHRGRVLVVTGAAVQRLADAASVWAAVLALLQPCAPSPPPLRPMPAPFTFLVGRDIAQVKAPGQWSCAKKIVAHSHPEPHQHAHTHTHKHTHTYTHTCTPHATRIQGHNNKNTDVVRRQYMCMPKSQKER